nr:hypothetical protein [Candidatus Microthrix sp.]
MGATTNTVSIQPLSGGTLRAPRSMFVAGAGDEPDGWTVISMKSDWSQVFAPPTDATSRQSYCRRRDAGAFTQSGR